MISGFAVALAGAVALAAVVAVDGPTAWALASLWLLGVGLGCVAITSVLGPQSGVAWGDRGAVTSAIFAARMLGGSLAVAALGAAGSGAREAGRFVGVATLALAGLALSALLAPHPDRSAQGEAPQPAAE